jgi:hypothetical protein
MKVRLLPAAMLVVVFGMGMLVAPPCVVACSCMEPRPVAEYAAEPGAAIFVGRAGATAGDAILFAVERWYRGAGAAPVVMLIPGDSAMCGIAISPGDRMVMVAYRTDDGRFRPSLCSPHARVDSPEGAKLLAEANTAFGAGAVPVPGETPTPPGGGPGSGTPGGGTSGPGPWLLMGAAAAGLVALGVGLLFAARRRPGGA